jgi:hypothetical protein
MPAAPQGVPIADQQTSPYAYQQPGAFGGMDYQATSQPAAPPSRLLIIGIAIILVACCAFACGFLAGFEGPYFFFPASTPSPTPRPTRESLLPILYALGIA